MSRFLPVLLLLISTALVFLLWPSEMKPSQAATVPSPTETETESVDERQGGAAPEAPSPAPAATGEARQQVDATPPATKSVVLRGRCVDVAGAPIAGVQVDVGGWRANEERMNRYRREHGEVQWTEPEPCTTGPDGLFEFAFVPPPPYQFTLDLQKDGMVPMAGRWGRLEPGVVKDFGDIEFLTGCMVRGRVTDTEGRPVAAKTMLYIDRYNAPGERGEIYPRQNHHPRTVADGTFALRRGILPGEWKLKVGRETIVSPVPFVVPRQRAEWFVEIVVKATSEVPTIRGVVVDDAGQPVARADIDVRPRRSGRGWIINSGKQGEFVVRKTDRDSGVPVHLHVSRLGYEHAVTEKKVEWGSDGHRIVLRRGLGVDLLVTDGDTGKLVEEYSVIAAPAPGYWRGYSSRERRLRNRGRHEGGRTVVTGLRRGHYNVMVEPASKQLLPSCVHEFEVRDGALRELHIKVYSGVDRKIVVQTKAGRPIPGSKLELLQPIRGTKVDFKTWIVRMHSSSSSSGRTRALLVHEGVTDAEGRCVLGAPPRQGYVLRVLGPGHRPHIENDVEVAAGLSPLHVEVAAGARVMGRVVPIELVRQLFGLAKADRDKPGIRLRRRSADGGHEGYPAKYGDRFFLDQQGRFVVAGVPPGDWEMRLVWRLNDNEAAGTLTALQEGETREIELELQRLLLAQVSGRVTHNGEVVTGGNLTLKIDRSTGEQSRWTNLPLDNDGRFRAFVVPDAYDLVLQLKVGKRRWSMLPTSTRMVLSPGLELTRDLDFTSGEVTLRIKGPDGKPRAGVRVKVVDPARSWHAFVDTDKAGTTKLLAPRGGLKFYVWPKRLMDGKAQQEFWKQHANDPGAWERQRIEAGAAVVGRGAQTVDVALPANSGY